MKGQRSILIYIVAGRKIRKHHSTKSGRGRYQYGFDHMQKKTNKIQPKEEEAVTGE
jgi:hypothetical protein